MKKKQTVEPTSIDPIEVLDSLRVFKIPNFLAIVNCSKTPLGKLERKKLKKLLSDKGGTYKKKVTSFTKNPELFNFIMKVFRA